MVQLKIYDYFKNMSQEFKMKNIDETRNNLLEEIKQNELMSKKYKKVCTTLNYIEHFLILALQLLDVFQFLILLPCLVFLQKLRVLQ